jgi:hypothetical protein
MSKVKRALKRAAAYSAGGSVGPAPKSNKLVGEFRDPTERAGGIPWLIPYGKNPINVSRELGARRMRNPNEPYPDVGRARAALADGGSVIDDLRESFEMAGANQPSAEERAANYKTTGMDALGVTPVIGNAMSARDAVDTGRESYEAARSGNLKRALGYGALTGLNAVGAVTGLPFGKMAGRVAREAPDRLNVMIPAPEGKANDLARDLRLQGMPNTSIVRNAERRFFGPDGSLRTEVDDRGMTLKRDFQPGDQAPMGDIIDHPALFGQRPDMRDIPVEFTDKLTTEANQPGRKFGVARTAPSGNFEITAGQPVEFYREQLAKLLQYDVAAKEKWGAAIRHDVDGVRRDYGNAMRVALDIIDNPRPGEDVGAALAYLERMRPMYDMLMQPGPEMANKAYKAAAKTTSGNIDGRIVRARALHTPGERSSAGPYPYSQGVRGVGPNWEKGQVIPQPHAGREDVAKMLADMQDYGLGAPKFANGGRAKRVGQALKRARVTVGAVMGRTGGRADALQVSVPAGAYVVPADVVAALGEGNSAAGMEKLGKQFPVPRARRANGGAVPIHISDGEFVVHPDAVAALGRGDPAHGHDILDAFVLSTRNDHINHLKSLPGPNQ